jgi:hypothetical protein
MEASAPPVAQPAPKGRTAWIVAGAIAALWVPYFAALVLPWFDPEHDPMNWLRGLPAHPGALLAAALLLPFDRVDPLVYQVTASVLALALAGALATVALRSRHAALWLCGGAVLSLAQAILLAFLATHG